MESLCYGLMNLDKPQNSSAVKASENNKVRASHHCFGGHTRGDGCNNESSNLEGAYVI